MSMTDWEKMYALAEQILPLEPWENCLENEMFAIQPREDSPVYFVSIMGSQGGHEAIAYYPGMESLSRFRLAQSDIVPERLAIENFLLTHCLQVTFETRQNLIPKDRAILKSLGKRYRGKWPAFRSQRPARIPWIPSDEEARDLCLLMEQSLLVIKRLDAGEDLLEPFDSEEFFLRTWDGRDSTCRVADLPIPCHILTASLPSEAIENLSPSGQHVEMDLVLLMTPISDGPSGEAPYLPLMLLMVDSESSLVLGFESLSTVEGTDAALVRIPDAITQILQKNNAIPALITARHPILLSALQAYANSYGLKFRESATLPALDEVVDSLLESFGS